MHGKAGLIKMLPDKSVVTFDRDKDAIEGDAINCYRLLFCW